MHKERLKAPDLCGAAGGGLRTQVAADQGPPGIQAVPLTSLRNGLGGFAQPTIEAARYSLNHGLRRSSLVFLDG
jgi:hypothetical protein